LHWSIPASFGWWLFSSRSIARPNKSVKGTRRPLVVLKVYFYQSSAASSKFSERRAPYRNVRLSLVKVVGFGLSSSASVVTGSFLVCFGLPLPGCRLVLAVARFGLGFGLLRWLLCLASLAG